MNAAFKLGYHAAKNRKLDDLNFIEINKEILNTPEAMADFKNGVLQFSKDCKDYEEKKENYKYKLLKISSNLIKKAESKQNAVSRELSFIPFGQPILVGHHSESKHRNLLKRAHNVFNKAHELANKASYYESRAEKIGKGGISSDDPSAIIKLKEKLEELEIKHQKMLDANACIRKNDRVGLEKLGFLADDIECLFNPKYSRTKGFEPYQLQYSKKEQKRIKDRILQLEYRQNRENKEIKKENYIYKEEENRIIFKFNNKPNKETISVLKKHGLKWSPSRLAWVCFFNEYKAKEIMEKLDKLENIY